jgi:hypothetical protein
MEIALEAHRQHDRKAAVDLAAPLLGGREKAELARQFFEAGVPSEVAAAAIAAIMRRGPSRDGSVTVISVGADGVATVHDDLSSEPNDGIGRPVGNA